MGQSLKEFIISLDNSSQIIVIGMFLLFILLLSVFVIKPIILTSIRWRFFKSIHHEELANAQTTGTTLAQNKVESLSKNLFSELDELDKESKEDFEKIEKIADYKEKKKKEQ